MFAKLSIRHTAIAAALALSSLHVAHAQAPASAPPPAWKQGMPANMANSPLAPLAGKMTVTPASDIPIDRIKLPPGFKVEVWATGLPGGRAMARGDDGRVYVGTRAIGRVYEVTDAGGQRTVRTVVDNWKYIAFGPDGKLYVPFGAPCNICELPTPEYAQIRRYNPDGSGMEVIATGVRNSVGFDWHPVTRELWFSNHGRDWMGDDLPHDTMHRLGKTGQHFGFPHCHQGDLPDTDVKKDNPCGGVEKPVALMGPHAATMGVTFYTGNMFPAEYRNVAFNARKGSWNRTKKIGYDVVMIRSNPDGSNARIEPFMTGFMNEADQSFWGRPAYLLQMPDGSMLVSDEQLGAIYRVSYSR